MGNNSVISDTWLPNLECFREKLDIPRFGKAAHRRGKWVVCWILLIGMMLNGGLSMQAKSGMGQIRGQVTDGNGRPVADAEVRVVELQSGTLTNARGWFQISVPPGIFTIRITHLRYRPFMQTNISVANGEIRTLDNTRLTEQVLALEGTVVTATRTPRNINDLPVATSRVSQELIQQRNAKTSAEALREETGLFVQKTNHGGGSAIIRGLSSNQILILVDGIRMNNSTYRLGNHQYLTTVDQNMIEQIEVVHGPGSVLHGSDALGGAINLISRRPELNENGAGFAYQVNSLFRYASADNEKTGRAELSLANDRVALQAGFSGKEFGDLRRGANSNHPELEQSTNGLLQSPSGFQQLDFDSKLFYQFSAGRRLLLAYQYSEQQEVPRYDKYESGKNVLWLYSPQKRRLAYARYEHKMNRRFLTSMRWTLSYHLQEEGRITQKTRVSDINRELDNVQTGGLSAQLNLNYRRHLFTYGFDMYGDRVGSERRTTHLQSGATQPALRGRYPDNARYGSLGVFAQDEWYLSSRFISTAGLRYSYFQARFSLPEDPGAEILPGRIEQSFQALTGSWSLLARLNPNFSITASVAQAFRAPNLSDLGKLGESKGRTFEVPNTSLKPEKLASADLGIRIHGARFLAAVSGYYARISDLLASAPARYNNSAIIIQADDTLNVKHKENIGSAYITGVEGMLLWHLTPSLSTYANFAYTYGQNTTADEPVGGIPPVFGTAGIRWKRPTMTAELFTRFAGRQSRLSADDRDDTRIPTGGTPRWQIFSFRSTYRLNDFATLRLAAENLLDVNYREHGSGINGPGRNFVVTVELQR